MKKALLMTLLAGTLGLGTAAQAQDGERCDHDGQGYSKQENGKHHGKRGGRHGGKHGERHYNSERKMARIAKKLNLTEDQQAQIKSLRSAQDTERQALREEMKALRTKMRELDTTNADYAGQVVILADQQANLQRKKFIQRSEARQQFEAVLTEAQRTTLKEMKAKRKNRHGKHDY